MIAGQSSGALATPAIALGTPSPSQPVVTPSATPDWPLATAVAFYATETERVLGVQLEISRNNANLADAVNTQNAIELTQTSGTATAYPFASTATLRAEQTQIAEADAQRTAVAYVPTATVAAAKAKAEAETATYRAWAETFAVLGLGVLALVFAGVAVGAIRRKPAPVVVDKTTQIIHAPKATGGTGIERIDTPPVQDYESFVAWVGAVLAGETVAVDFWEERKRFVGSYRKVHIWLVKNGLIMRHPQSGRAVINAKGEQVLTAWLMANPLPLSDSIAKTAPPPSVNTDSVTTEAEGEGLQDENGD
jgi:hypothetical protein